MSGLSELLDQVGIVLDGLVIGDDADGVGVAGHAIVRLGEAVELRAVHVGLHAFPRGVEAAEIGLAGFHGLEGGGADGHLVEIRPCRHRFGSCGAPRHRTRWIGDFIQDDNVPVPADAAAFTLLKEQLVEVLSTLTDREQKVLRLRFGLDDGRARTLEEVGKEFNVTRERIRQIEAKALRKLRHPSRSRKLKDYLD